MPFRNALAVSIEAASDRVKPRQTPLELSVQEKQTVDVPIWAGVAAIVGGGVLLLFGARKR
jgi:hypothetical protein